MILKWNNGQKRALKIPKRALNIRRGRGRESAPHPSPQVRHCSLLVAKFACYLL